jgi:transposase
MAKPLLPDELWAEVAPLLPPPRPRPKGGRPPVADRKALTGILFVLKTGIQWEDLPQEMGCGCGMTCWRRLRDWHKAGVWQQLHALFLDRLAEADQIDWSRASLDSASVPAPHAPKGARRSGRRPWGRTRRTGASRVRSTISS